MSLALTLALEKDDQIREENARILNGLGLEARLAALEAILVNLNLRPAGSDALNAACSGFVGLVLVLSPETVTAAALNLAAAGTFKRTFHTMLIIPESGHFHDWYAGEPLLTPAEVCVDPDIGPPTIDGPTPSFGAGELEVTVTFDTDAGATKTYAAGDAVTVTVDVTQNASLVANPFLAGVATVVMTYDVV